MGDGSGILIVDDLVDTGKTLELVRRLYPKAHFATVYAKPQGRGMVDTYITEVSQDTWIFFPWDMALQYVQPYRGVKRPPVHRGIRRVTDLMISHALSERERRRRAHLRPSNDMIRRALRWRGRRRRARDDLAEAAAARPR